MSDGLLSPRIEPIGGGGGAKNPDTADDGNDVIVVSGLSRNGKIDVRPTCEMYDMCSSII